MVISLEEYLHTAYRPDCDFVEGHVMERNAGTRRHGYAQMFVGGWFAARSELRLVPFSETRLRVASSPAADGTMRTADGRVAMSLAGVLLP